MAGPAPSPPTRPSSFPGGPTAPPSLPPRGRERLDDLRQRAAALDGRWTVWLLVGMAVVGVGLWLLRPSPTPVEEVLPVASTAGPAAAGPTEAAGASGVGSPPGPAPAAVPEEIVAHAAGAVGRPGVYRLDATARVDDLVRAAGGLAPDADPSRLNLAAPLADGTRVYVPRAGEEVPAPVGPEGPAPGAAGPPGGSADGGTSGGLVDLNTADEAQLDELPGVGPATAAAIVAFRAENGGFRVVDDLLDVRGIGEAKLEQLRPLVTVG